MFQVSVLQGTTTCRTIRDYQAKFQIQDRLAFRRFLGLADKLPDAKTIWLFREHWVEAGGSCPDGWCRICANPRASAPSTAP
ncbi:transposase [Fulvimarina manganoxydans]|uniref:transposase n=1 Tax=Fulvimarina manganoxydans TaxID=937218 RepID=UPI001FCD08D2|nr:transposase [Fulvimarina manganoxydans]